MSLKSVLFHSAVLACLSLFFAGSGFAAGTQIQDYALLLDYIAMEDLHAPLIVFQDNDGDFDPELNRENLAYLNSNQRLLEKMKARLKGETLTWELSASIKRLLIVPEKRAQYARLFQSYCRTVVAYVLDRIQAPNPYQSIQTVDGPLAQMADDAHQGIHAYLVHNSADEYIEEYVFFNQENTTTKIKIKLQNRLFNGRIGSYTSKLIIGEDSRFEFVREPFTVWRNSARNPLNVFIAPVEETLHIVLRKSTESAIIAELYRKKPVHLKQVRAVVKDWMAVEEAIVGGLVAQLMPEVFDRFIQLPDPQGFSQALAERENHAQYRYLVEGIRIVSDLGLRQALNLYKTNPGRFREMVRPGDLS